MKRRSSSLGFTLIELLISMTIFALLVAVLYQAFATASRIWTKQAVVDETQARQIAVRRLFNDDFSTLVPYSYSQSTGDYSFFAGTPTVVFYATRNGFGARSRAKHGLFFVCCYLQQKEDGTQSIKLYKSAYPEKTLLDSFADFLQLDSIAQQSWLPPAAIKDHSLTLLAGLTDAKFSYYKQDQLDILTSDNQSDQLDAPESTPKDTIWKIVRLFPKIFQFDYQLHQQWTHQYVRVQPLPDTLAKIKTDK